MILMKDRYNMMKWKIDLSENLSFENIMDLIRIRKFYDQKARTFILGSCRRMALGVLSKPSISQRDSFPKESFGSERESPPLGSPILLRKNKIAILKARPINIAVSMNYLFCLVAI